jgi:hypothetical protein
MSRMRSFALWTATAFGAVGLAGCSGGSKSVAVVPPQPVPQAIKPVQPSTRPIAAQTVDLKFIEVADSPYGCYFGVHGGKISYPFSNAAGKLTIEIRDGKVYGDTNGDGVIDAKDSPAVEPGKGTLKFAMNLSAGRVVDFPVRVGELRKLSGDSADPHLELYTQGALEANVGEWTIRYAAMSFGNTPVGMFSQVSIAPTGSDLRFVSTLSPSQTYDIADRLYTVKLADDLTKLTVAPYTGEIAEVRFSYTLPEDTPPVAQGHQNHEDGTSLILRHTAGIQQSTAKAGKPAKFVPGDYQLASIFLTRFINQGEQVYISGRMDSKAAPTTLKPGVNEIRVGAPFKMDFVATRDGGQIELTDVMVTGRLGEMYAPPGQGPGSLFAFYIRGGGKETQLAKLEYG